MVLKFLHQADLGFLFHRFVGRTVFANAEGVVTPHELHWKFHQGSHTDSGLHVVREDKECTHSRLHTSVECNTDADTSHGEFAHTSL